MDDPPSTLQKFDIDRGQRVDNPGDEDSVAYKTNSLPGSSNPMTTYIGRMMMFNQAKW